MQNYVITITRQFGSRGRDIGIATAKKLGIPLYDRNVLEKEAEEIGGFLAKQGAEQCGFCNPGFLMNIFAMLKELENPTEAEINEYLAGNLCRCSGFMGQTRSILNYLEYKKKQKKGWKSRK